MPSLYILANVQHQPSDPLFPVSPMGIFIPTNKLENLRLYKYSLEDHSIILRYVLKKWWNYFVHIFPLLMAPNAITLLGLMWVVASLFVVFYYDPYLNQDLPSWCYFFYALCLFMYQTFDGCDGCHARRTGQLGPLGELFDHCVDAINTTLGAIVFASVTQMGWGKLMMLSQFAATCNFYASTWEEYHTHTLFLSEFSGPVEGILMICGVYVLTGFIGPGIWKAHLFNLDLSSIGLSSEYLVSMTAVYVVLGLGSLYFNIHQAILNVKKYYKQLNKANPEEAKRRTDQAVNGWWPFVLYWLLVVGLVAAYPEFIYRYGFPLVISVGLTIAFTVGRIILAHLTLQPFPYRQFPMIVAPIQLALVWFLTNVYHFDYLTVVLAVLWIGLGTTLGIHGSFIAEIIYEITTYLDIYTLSIKHKRA